MDAAKLLETAAWITQAGLAGARERDLLEGFCLRLSAAGMALARAVVGLDTLHPTLEGRVFEWRREAGTIETGYGRNDPGNSEENWTRSPFFRLLETGASHLRRRLCAPDADTDEFPVLAALRSQNVTDYLAMVSRFGKGGVVGEMDCAFSSWATDRPEGFSAADIAALDTLVPMLAFAVRSAAVGRIAETLMETYLGRDAGQRVLRGQIERGRAERIEAVLWFSDLHGYTRITDTAPPEQVIALLNDYADAIISAIHAHGGEVLKLIGDGVLALFRGSGEEMCRSALDAAEDARRRIAALNARRHLESLPVTRFYVGLHFGEVFYGNIGSADRLDFTVVGPAVNEASRISAMCRSLDQDVLLSSSFADAAGACRARLVSVGRYALRGVRRPQELFTLAPDD